MTIQTSSLTPKLLDNGVIRQAFPVLQEVTYLNVGTYGLMPAPALESFQALQAEFESRGVASNGGFGRQTEATRKRIAEMIGGSSDEIAFTRNATDGINLVLAGIDWQPGDDVITTTEEHEATNHPLTYLRQMKGIGVKMVEVSPRPEEMLARLEAVVSPRTRLVTMSYITCETGTRLPARAISDWAASRSILSLFDGAQASGAFSVNVQEMGCDFYASNGHKWLGGPKGSGFFWGKRDRLSDLYLAHVGAGSLERVDIPNGVAVAPATGHRFEFGTRAWALSAGLGCSLDWLESIGWANVYGHIAALSDYLKASILARPWLKLITPLAFEDSSGLTSFIIEGKNAQAISNACRERHRIYLRVIPHYNAIRVSTAHFNNPEDIDRLMAAVEQVKNE